MKKITFLFLVLPMLSFYQVQIGDDIDGTSETDRFGFSVSMSSDGSIVAVGSDFGDGTAFNSGIVRIYENINDAWIQLGSDINGLEFNGLLSYSIDLSSDGSIIVIGAITESGTSADSGVVKVYQFQNNSWTLLGNVINGIAPLDQFGRGVAISSNGSIIAISAPQSDANGTDSGQALIFQLQNNSWVQLGNAINGSAQFDRFGYSIDISSDGSIVAIGAIGYDTEVLGDIGHVRVYQYQGNNWNILGDEIIGQSGFDQSGKSLNLSSDGMTIAIGSPGSDVNGVNTGAVNVYKFENNNWQQNGNTIISEASDDFFSESLSLNSDGSVLAVGAVQNDGNGSNSGQARIYKNENNNWTQVGSDIDGEAAEDNFGNSISISDDGLTVAIGGFNNDVNGINSGHVRVYDLTDPLSIDEFQDTTFQLYPNPAKNKFIIQLNDASILEKVKIYNTLGQEVLNTKKHTVNTSRLTSGTYIVEIQTNQGKASKMLIID